MRHKKRLITVSVAVLMLVSLCAVCATTSVTAANSRDTRAASVGGAGTVGSGPIYNWGTAVCSWGPNRLDVFATGSDLTLWHSWWDGSWHSENMGAPAAGIRSAPTAVSWGSGRIDVFGRDNSGNLWQLWFDASNGGWHPWNNLGSPIGTFFDYWTAPAASSWGAGRLDVFAVGHDGNLYQKFYQNEWSVWKNLGNPGVGITHGSPGAVSTSSWGYNRVDVFVRGDDSTLYQRWWSPSSGWQWWKVEGTEGRVVDWGGYVAPPLVGQYSACYYGAAVCSWGANRLDVFFVDNQGYLQQKYFENGWKPLYRVGGIRSINGPGGAVTWQNGGKTRLDIFTPSDDCALYQMWWQSPSGWSNWYNLGYLAGSILI